MPDAVSRVDQLNQVVRALSVLILLVAFVAAYLWGVVVTKEPLITSGEFLGVLTLAMTWFFKSRDEKAAATTAPAPPAAGSADAR